jgi:hypothetical protein
MKINHFLSKEDPGLFLPTIHSKLINDPLSHSMGFGG